MQKHEINLTVSLGFARIIKILFWWLSALAALAGCLLFVIVQYEDIRRAETTLAISRSWVKPSYWNKTYQLMLDDCIHNHGASIKTSLPDIYGVDIKYVYAFQIVGENTGKPRTVVVFSGSAIDSKPNEWAPKALTKQALACAYDSTTEAFVGAKYSKNGQWHDT